MKIPNLSAETFAVIEKYNKHFPKKYMLGTLDLNPDLEEQDLVKYLEEAIDTNKTITFRNKKVYLNPKKLPNGILL